MFKNKRRGGGERARKEVEGVERMEESSREEEGKGEPPSGSSKKERKNRERK